MRYILFLVLIGFSMLGNCLFAQTITEFKYGEFFEPSTLDVAINSLNSFKEYHESQQDEIYGVQAQINAIKDSLPYDFEAIKADLDYIKNFKMKANKFEHRKRVIDEGSKNHLYRICNDIFLFLTKRRLISGYLHVSQLIQGVQEITKPETRLFNIKDGLYQVYNAIKAYKTEELNNYFIDIRMSQYNIFVDTGPLLNHISNLLHFMQEVAFVLKTLAPAWGMMK